MVFNRPPAPRYFPSCTGVTVVLVSRPKARYGSLQMFDEHGGLTPEAGVDASTDHVGG